MQSLTQQPTAIIIQHIDQTQNIAKQTLLSICLKNA